MWHGGGPGGRIWQLTIAQLREPIIDRGLMSPTEVDAALTLCDDPQPDHDVPAHDGALGACGDLTRQCARKGCAAAVRGGWQRAWACHGANTLLPQLSCVR